MFDGGLASPGYRASSGLEAATCEVGKADVGFSCWVEGLRVAVLGLRV